MKINDFVINDSVAYKNRPFSDSEHVCDSSLWKGDIVEHTTSWLTINPIKGCSLACAYCFREKWNEPNKPYTAFGVEESIEALINHKDFIAHKTPISINISSTDCLLPTVKDNTFACLQLLDNLNLKNIVGLTTKLKFSQDDIIFLSTLKNIRLIIYVSYADIPFRIEPVSLEDRITNLELLKSINIPTILYFRPIVKGWNDDDVKIKNILSIAKKYTNAVVIGGLRISKEISDVFEKRKIDYPKDINNFYHKNIPLDILEKISRLADEIELTIPIYLHTSCANSYVFDMPNYNFLFEEPTKNCVKTCPPSQRNLCNMSVDEKLLII